MSNKSKVFQKSILAAAAMVSFLAVFVAFLGEDMNAEGQKISDAENSVVDLSRTEGAQLDDSQSIYEGILERSVASNQTLPYKSIHGALPDSLEGTVMKQALVVDEQGHLRISSDIKRVFDYFLSTIDEEELDTILARINEYLEYHLDQPGLDESKQILAQYIGLKQALFDFEQQRSATLKSMVEGGQISQNREMYLTLLTEQLNAQSALRMEYLNPEVYEAFFAEDEAFDQYSLARMTIESDASLSSDQKQQALSSLDSLAPAHIVESRERAQVTDVLKERTAQLKTQGASQQDIRTLRTEMLGIEAADRFDMLDQQREIWKTRLSEYLAQRSEILSLEGISVQERQLQVDSLRSSQFNTREQIRVRVYEQRSDA